jgi:hypothetical protein
MITLRQFGIAAALGLTATATPSVAVDAARTAVSGTFVFDADGACPGPPSGYEDFTDYPVVVSGDLEGCWYTKIDEARDLRPSGIHLEVGREVFVGSVRGGPEGTFSTAYNWQSKWDPDIATGTEVWGHCQHLIVRGSGTGGLQDVTGLILRTDVAPDATVGSYRGSLHQP